jgi:hypothetical protein
VESQALDVVELSGKGFAPEFCNCHACTRVVRPFWGTRIRMRECCAKNMASNRMEIRVRKVERLDEMCRLLARMWELSLCTGLQCGLILLLLFFSVIPFYSQSAPVHSANCVETYTAACRRAFSRAPR